MAGCRCTALQSRPRACLDCTSRTLAECQPLVPPCEAACHARMAAGRLDGKPRTARRLTGYHNCPLPPPAERLLCIRVSLKPYALQGVQGRLCGRGQRTAKRWRPLRLPARLAARRALGDAPARSRTAWAPRRGGAAAAAATLVAPLAAAAAPA